MPAEYRAKFADAVLPHPPNYKPVNDPYADGWARLSDNERARLEAWRRNYYAMTTNLDWNFGRLMKYLDESGLAGNTVVVFTSDHGEMFGAHGRRAKNIFSRSRTLLNPWSATSSDRQVDTCSQRLISLHVLGSMAADTVGLRNGPVATAPGRDGDERITPFCKAPVPPIGIPAMNGSYSDCTLYHAKFRIHGRRRSVLFDNVADPIR